MSKTMTKITIHQPEHLPYLGFIDKVKNSDILIYMDDVQYRKNYYQNRNKIRTKTGNTYITVPVNHNSDTLIKDVTIANVLNWKDKYLSAVREAYKTAINFDKYYSLLEREIRFNTMLSSSLCDLNINLLENILFPAFKVFTMNKRMSSLKLRTTTDGSDKVLAICQYYQDYYGAVTYVSGPSGKDYLRLDEFKKSKIDVIFNEYHPPLYKQQFDGFEVGMSSLDYLMNVTESAI